MSATPPAESPAAAAASSPSSSSPVPVSLLSSHRYSVPHGYDPLAQPNPCAHVQAAPIMPKVFDQPRKPVRFEDGWEFYRKIGSPKYVLAPMVNQSELAFRVLCRRYKSDYCFTPMNHAEIFSKDPKYRQEAVQVPRNAAIDRPVVYQFCGHDPQHLLNAAKLVEDVADAVDLNCGCPQNIAKRGFYGAFLLEHTQLLHDIVSTLHQHLRIPITVKIRRLPASEDGSQTSEERTIALVKMLQEAGAAMITIHGRTRFQLKDKVGEADFDLIRLVKQNCAVPVFANGGIFDLADVDRCLAYTGVDGVMSSEGILCNPSLFAGKRVDSLDMAREYMDIVRELEAEGLPTEQSMVRGHLFKMCYQHLSLYTDLRDRLGGCTPEEFDPILSELTSRFRALPAEEQARLLATVPLWYWRHVQTPAQIAAAEAKAAQKLAEKQARQKEEEEGMGDGFCLFEEC